MKYSELPDSKKKNIITKLYLEEGKSFKDIANVFETYANKIRRDAIKLKIPIRDKSTAQKNALITGKHKHPTKGTKRDEVTKNKIGNSVMHFWDQLDDVELESRRKVARQNWNNLSDDQKANIQKEANNAVRLSSKTGSKLEKFLFNSLIQDGYRVDFHKEQTLSNTKLQIDLFLPNDNIAIEVDGPSHFLPVWGEETLLRNQAYDNKKTGLIIGKGLVLIRVKQLKEFSKARASTLYSKLLDTIKQIQHKFPSVDHRHIEIGD